MNKSIYAILFDNLEDCLNKGKIPADLDELAFNPTAKVLDLVWNEMYRDEKLKLLLWESIHDSEPDFLELAVANVENGFTGAVQIMGRLLAGFRKSAFFYIEIYGDEIITRFRNSL